MVHITHTHTLSLTRLTHQRWTPALPKPTPAYVLARCIADLASVSSGSFTDLCYTTQPMTVVYRPVDPLPPEVLANDPEGMEGPEVRDGVASLVGGAVGGIGWAWHPLAVRQGRVGLQGVAEHVKSTVHSHVSGHPLDVEWVHQPQQRPDATVTNP